MKGDFSRKTFNPSKHYSGVRMQQGRVQLDSDWNEQLDIASWRTETTTRDLVGHCGAPMGNDGFRVVANAAGLTPDEAARPGNASLPAPSSAGDFLITAGRFYAGGVLCQNDSITTFTDQEDYPDAEAITDDGLYLAYLDVWPRHVTAMQDSEIREVALGGPDTATRTRTMAQVKMLRVGEAGDAGNCASTFEEWDNLVAPPDGKLTAQAEPDAASDDPCIVAPGAGYRRLGNQLYRVEVHQGGPRGTATFKWSRENGSVAVKWESIDGSKITVGRNVVGTFLAGDWVELTDETKELYGQPGTMVRVTKVEGQVIEVDLGTATGSTDRGDFPRTPIVRRWNNKDGLLEPTNASWIDLEDGVQIKISSGEYRTGDYWLIPARTATADIEWPTDSDGDPIPQLPQGIDHNYCRLAVLRFAGGAWTSITDCRPIFPPVTELTSLFYLGGDGQQVAPDTSDLSQLLPLPEKLRVGVANGQHPVQGAQVQFSIELGSGELSGGASPFTTTTNEEGVAECEWSLDSTTEVQAVTARLLHPDGSASHLDIRFSAALSLASRVAYQPSDCDKLAGAKTVQEALDILCSVSNEGCAIPVKPSPNWRETLELLIAGQERVHLCFHPGDFELSEPLVFKDKQSVLIEGAGMGTRFLGTGHESVLRFECCEAVTLRDFYAQSQAVDDTGSRKNLNGVITIASCFQVILERLFVVGAPGTVRTSTCITVRNNVDEDLRCDVQTWTRVSSCDFFIGHMQTGLLVVNSNHVSISDNRMFAVGRPEADSVSRQLETDNAFRAAMAKRILRVTNVAAVGAGGRTPGNTPGRVAPGAGNQPVNRIAVGEAPRGPQNLSGAIPGVPPRVEADKAFEHTATTSVTIRTRGFELTAVTPLALASMWTPLFNATLERKFNSIREFGLDVQRVVNDMLIGKIDPTLTEPFDDWLERATPILPPVASQGIVVGGTVAPDVRIKGNTIESVRQGIHVGLSRREPKPSEFYAHAGVATIDDNTISLYLSSEMRGERHGIFAGNCDSLMIGGNFINIIRDSSNTQLRTEGIRVYGHLGPRMIARANHIEGATIGVRVEPLTTLKSRQWLVADTMATDATPVQAPDSVQQVNNIG